MKATLSFLVLALAAPAVLAQCPIGTPGVQEASPPVDGWSGLIPIGFSFPYNGTTYTDFYYSDHGLISLSNAGSPGVPPGGAQTYDPGSQPNTAGVAGGGFAGFNADVICAYWGDHTVGGGGIWIDSRPTHCTITWFDSEPYLNFIAGRFTAQMTLYQDGRVVVCLDNRCNNTSSTFDPVTTVIGVYQNGSTIPASSDLSTNAVVTTDPTCYEEFTGPGPVGSNTPDPNFDLGNSTITFIPAGPGWIVTVDPLICASTATVGNGCFGLSLASTSSPVLGGTWNLELSGVTAPAPLPNFLALGAETAPVPVGVLLPSLFGAGCEAVQNLVYGLVDIGAATGGVASFQLPIPNDATLKGFSLTAQGLSLLVAGPTPFALSDGQTGTLGY